MNMFVIVILLVVLVAIAVFLKAKQPAGGAGLTFEARIPLFSPAERSFLGGLNRHWAVTTVYLAKSDLAIL